MDREAETGAPELAMDDLTRMSAAELGEIYRQARAPQSLRALDGTGDGRLLAPVGTGRGVALGAVRKIAAARAFPWTGKRFESAGDDAGEGVNCLRGLGERYRFTTRFTESVVDHQPCVVLDYDRDDNPRLIRRVRDELRQVTPGLFLGPATVRTGGGHRTVFYFAVQT